MQEIFHGRYTAQPQQDFVVFIIGMRVNKWWKFHKWIPIVLAMPKMIQVLSQKKELGFYSQESFFRLFPVTSVLISYWKTYEDLESFAFNKQYPHPKAWSDYVKSVGSSGDVGVYHETYRISPFNYECVYANMPRFGLGRAFELQAISKNTETAKLRISQTPK